MIQHVLAVFLVGVLTLGFSWGSREEEKAAEKASEVKSSVSSNYSSAKNTAEKAVSNAKSASSASSKASSARTAAAPANQEFPSELLGQLAAGDEETRRARMESLKRLSQALSQMNAKSQTPAGTRRSAS